MPGCSHCGSVLDLHARFCPECGRELGAQEHATLPGNAPSAPKTDPLIGREVIGQFIIERRIGEGGMGAVYLARQPSMDRKVVIKVLHPVLSAQPEVARRFQTEAKAAARLQDARIVQVFNYGAMADGTLFLAMEYLPGRSLDQVIREAGRLPPTRALAIAIDIARALREAHRHGVVHRDLKPSNVMVVSRAGEEQIKVLDFGVAHVAGGSGTQTDSPVGTPRYMSPEQLDGRPVDGRSDLYALGIVLYEMVVGAPPFEAETPVAYIHKHIAVPPPPPRVRAPEAGISPELEQLILSCLAKTPGERPGSADAFLERAQSIVESGTETAAASPSASSPSPATAAGKGTGLLLAGLGAAALALLGVGAWALRGMQRTPDETSSASAMSAPTDSTQQASRVIVSTSGAAASERRASSGTAGITGTDTADPAPKLDAGTDALTPVIVQRPPRPPTPSPRDTQGSATTGAGTGLPPLSPQAQKLLRKSISELEKELRRLVDGANIPPSSKTQLYDAYGMYAAGLPDDAQGRHNRKVYLVQVILGYRAVPRLPRGFHRPLSDLKRVLFELDSPVTVPQRKQTLADTTAAFMKTAKTPEDRDYWRRSAIINLVHGLSQDETYFERAIGAMK